MAEEHEAGQAAARKARRSLLHGLANSLHVLIAGLEELGPLTADPEARALLAQLKAAGASAGKQFAALRGLLG